MSTIEITGAYQLNNIKTFTRGELSLENFNQNLYKRINNAYYGIGGFEDGSYLTQYPAEDPEDYEARKEDASYDNFFQTEINYKTDPVFSKTVVREVKNKRLEAFTKRSTTSNQSLSKHMSELMIQAELNTTVFEIVTAPNKAINDNRDLSVLPYLITVTPLKCSGYYKDSSGDLIVLVWQTGKTTANGTEYNRFNVWEKTPSGSGIYYVVEVAATTSDSTVIDLTSAITSPVVKKDGIQIPTPFEVPAYPVKMVEMSVPVEPTEAPPAKYGSISKQLITMFNLDNMITKGFANVCFSPVTYNTETGDAPKEAQIGDNNVLGYAKDLDAPARMKVETSHFEVQQDKLEKLKDSIRRQMDSYTQISDNSSGEARKEAGRKIIQYWQKVAKEATGIEKWIYDTIQENYIKTNEDVVINYSTDFSSLTPDVIIKNAEDIIDTFGLEDTRALQLIYDNTVSEVYGDDPTFAEELKDAFKEKVNMIGNTDEPDEPDVTEEDE